MTTPRRPPPPNGKHSNINSRSYGSSATTGLPPGPARPMQSKKRPSSREGSPPPPRKRSQAEPSKALGKGPERAEARRDSLDQRPVPGSTQSPIDLTGSSRTHNDNRSSLATRSPWPRQGDGSGTSTPIQIAPVIPPIIPNNSDHVASSPLSVQTPPVVSLQTLDDWNEKINYVKSRERQRRITHQDNLAPVTLANLQKMRSTKEAVLQADIAAYEKRWGRANFADAVPKATTTGSGADTYLENVGLKVAEERSLEIVTNQLKEDNKAMAIQFKLWEEERKLWGVQMNERIQEQVKIAMQQQVQQKIRDQITAYLEEEVTPNMSSILKKREDEIKSLSTLVLPPENSKQNVEGQKLSHLYQRLSKKVAEIDGIQNRITEINEILSRQGGEIGQLQQKLESVTRETSAKISALEERITKAVDPVAQQIEAFEGSINHKLDPITHANGLLDTKFSKQISGLETKVSDLSTTITTLKGEQEKAIQKDIDREIQIDQEKSSRVQADTDTREYLSKLIRDELSKKIGNIEECVSRVEHNDKTNQNELHQEFSTIKSRITSVESSTNTIPALQSRISTVEEIQRTSNQIDLSQDLLALDGRVKVIEATQDNLDQTHISQDLSALEERVKIIEVNYEKTVRKDLFGKLSILSTQLQTEIAKSKNPSATLLTSDLQALRAHIKELGNDLTSVEESLHTCKANVQLLKDGLPKTIIDIILPIQNSLHDRLEKVDETLSAQSKAVTLVRLQMQTKQAQAQSQPRLDLSSQNNSRMNSPQPLTTENDRQIKWLAAEVKRLDEIAKARAPELTKTNPSNIEAVQGLRDQIAIANRAIQSLEHRYENINTAELHQQMVHHFQQMYPAAPGMFEQLRGMQNQVTGLNEKFQILERNWDPLKNAVEQAVGVKTDTDQLIKAWHFIESQIGVFEKKIDAERAERTNADDGIRSVLKNWNTSFAQRVVESEKKTDVLETRLSRIEEDTNMLDTRVTETKEEMKENRERTIRAETDASILTTHISEVSQVADTLDRCILKLEGETARSDQRIKKLESFEVDVNKRMPDIDKLISSKDDMYKVLKSMPFLEGNIYRVARATETINMNAERPVKNLNLESTHLKFYSDGDGSNSG